MAVELVDPRRALEVVSRNLSLLCCDRWLELVVIGVGCLGLDFAQRLCAAEALSASVVFIFLGIIKLNIKPAVV